MLKFFIFTGILFHFQTLSAFDLGSLVDRFTGGKIGFLAVSAKTNEILAEHNPHLLLNPASNVKLVTTLAALELLHPEYRFKTEYYVTSNGDLLVKGYGDPTITNERLQTVARHLKMLGAHRITGNLILDESYFGGENIPTGWEREKDSHKLHSAVPSALALNHNIATFLVRPGKTGEQAVVLSDPPIDYFKMLGSIQTAPKNRRLFLETRDMGNYITVSLGGKISEYSKPLWIRKKIFHPRAYFGSTLAYFLAKEGIETSLALERAPDYKNAQLLYTDKSPALSQIVGEVNKTSSNFMAEMLVKVIAGQVSTPAKYDTGLLAIAQFLEKKVGLSKNSFIMVNGSGLGTLNRFSAWQLVKLLGYAEKNFELSSEYVASLGVAGTQGTLSRRMKKGPAMRNLRAKTGTLVGVSSLSGYVGTRGDDQVIFSILVQGKPKAMSKARWLEDRIGISLASLYTEEVPNLAENTDPEEAEESEEFQEASGG